MTTTPSPSVSLIAPTGTSVGPFATGWTYVDAADVRVAVVIDGRTGPDLTPGADYSVSGATPSVNGGTVTLAAGAVPVGGWTAAHRLAIRRRTARRQGVALPDTEGHKPRATETALDRAMRIAEELTDLMARGVIAPLGETGLEIPTLAARSNRLAGFDADGNLVGSSRTLDEFDAALITVADKVDRVELSPDVEIGKAGRFYDYYGGTVAGLDAVGDGVILNSGNADTPNSPRSWEFRRLTTYSGGSNQVENALLHCYLQTNPEAASVETAVLVQLVNRAVKTGPGDGGQNAALHIRALKESNAPTWGIAFESQDSTGLADPLYGLHVTESVIAANGSDLYNNRVAHDVIASRPSVNLGAGPVYSGAAAEIGYGTRYVGQVADAAANTFKTVIGIGGRAKDFGINLAACIVAGQAINLADTQTLSWNNSQKLFHSGSALFYSNGASNTFALKDNGNAYLFGDVGIGAAEAAYSGYRGLTIGSTDGSLGGLTTWTNGTDSLQAQTVSGGAVVASSGALILQASGATEHMRAQSGLVTLGVPIRLKAYTVATKPSAGLGAGAEIYLSDYSRPQAAYSDGSAWRLVSNPATTV